MTDDEFDSFLLACSDDQVAALRELRSLIRRNCDGLDETLNSGKWLKGFVFYSTSGQMIYAMGPKGKGLTSLHLMPYYGSPTLQERHGAALSQFLTGKSCIAFRRYSDLPVDALTDIIGKGTPVMVRMLQERARDRRDGNK